MSVSPVYSPISFMTHRSFSVILSWHIGYLSQVRLNLHRSWPTDRCNWHRLQSVCPSVRHTSVFRTLLCHLLRYWLEIWYVNLSWHNTDQVRVFSHLTYFTGVYINLSWHKTNQVWVSSCLTYFYRSYCPLLKFCFPDFSLPSFEILTCNLVYEFVKT